MFIEKLDPKKTSQKFDMSTNILKINTAFYAKYICDDINALIRSLKFLNKLKKAYTVPMHKKKSKFSKENCRPISILPNISKVYMTKMLVWPNIKIFRRYFLKVSIPFSQGSHCTALPVGYNRKMEKILDYGGVFGALLTD